MEEKSRIIGTLLVHDDDEGPIIIFAPSADFDRCKIDEKIKWAKEIKNLSEIIIEKFEKDRDNG
jgi:hypothetical protein